MDGGREGGSEGLNGESGGVYFTTRSIMKAGSGRPPMKIKAGKRKNVAARAANIVAARLGDRAVADTRAKLLIAPLVLEPAVNVDVTGTTNRLRSRTGARLR